MVNLDHQNIKISLEINQNEQKLLYEFFILFV